LIRSPDHVRIAIIGAGPAGLAAGMRAAELGLSHVVIDRADRLCDTLYRYHKGKLVIADGEAQSALRFTPGKREAVIAEFEDQLSAKKIKLKLSTDIKAVARLRRKGGGYRLSPARGKSFTAENIILAFGAPYSDRLPVKGKKALRPLTALDDASRYEGQDILVIGDSKAALDVAQALSQTATGQNRVTLLHPAADGFARGELGDVKLLRHATLRGWDGKQASIDARDGATTLPCDTLFAFTNPAPEAASLAKWGIAVMDAYPLLSETYETSKPGIYAVGALAGASSIVEALDQGHHIVGLLAGQSTQLAPPKAEAIVPAMAELETKLGVLFGPSLPAKDRAALIASGKRVSVQAGKPLYAPGRPSGTLYLLLAGSVIEEVQVAGRPAILRYLRKGEVIGALSLVRTGSSPILLCASTRCDLLMLYPALLKKLLKKHAQALQSIKDRVAAQQDMTALIGVEAKTSRSVADLFAATDAFASSRDKIAPSATLLIDEKLCLHCHRCETACADTYGGVARINHKAGKAYGALSAPVACHDCAHPSCLAECPVDAISRKDNGEVVIADHCTGCGLCVQNCPHDVIQMAQNPADSRGLLSRLFAKPVVSDVQPKAAACTMCADRPTGPACVSACPTAAIQAVSLVGFADLVALQMEQG
jgi:Fe-S-cluster-containing hydrogenase component 2/thioredoxin reductase